MNVKGESQSHLPKSHLLTKVATHRTVKLSYTSLANPQLCPCSRRIVDERLDAPPTLD